MTNKELNNRNPGPAPKVKRCYYCGAKTEVACGEWTIFHRPGCKPAETKGASGKSRAEELYPGISHGGYVSLF